MNHAKRLLPLAPIILLAGAVALACGSDAGAPNEPLAGGGGDSGTTPPVRSPFGLDTRPSNRTCLAPARPPNGAGLDVKRVFPDVVLDNPAAGPPFVTGAIMLAQRPGDASRWYMSRRNGEIVAFSASYENGGPSAGYAPPVVADLQVLTGMPVLTEDEQGFHSMAFDPAFATNGYLYVSFTTKIAADGGDFATEIGRLQSADGGESFTAGYTTILHYTRGTQPEHHGGSLAFANADELLISAGDSTDDTLPQRLDSLLGKVLKIDVHHPAGGNAYGIPADNPFVGGGGRAEIFAWGFRNPYRLTVDRGTGEVWVGDVGDNKWEEVDRVERGGNYGWPCREGAHPYATDPEKCPTTSGLIDPVFDYPHEAGAAGGSITGGYVYRGSRIDGLQGTYVFGDFITKKLVGLTYDERWKDALLNPDGPADGWVSFAEDQGGELYAVSLVDRSIHKLVPKGASRPSSFPALLSQTGCVRPGDPKTPAEGVLPYGVNAPFWSDGATKERFFAIPDGTSIGLGKDGDFTLPIGSVTMKTFSLAGKRIETRLLVRHDDGEWGGYTYEWNDAGTDATLLPSSLSKRVAAQTWTYPARNDCPRCHTAGAGRTLGLELPQLNGDLVYASTNRISNQLATLDHLGMFEAPLGGTPETLAAYPAPFGPAALDVRARAYLHSNCSGCHRPAGGAGRSTMDLRFGTPLAETNACLAKPIVDDLGSVENAILTPGAPARSIASLRIHATDAKRMPPLSRQRVDPDGAALVDAWITSLTGCN